MPTIDMRGGLADLAIRKGQTVKLQLSFGVDLTGCLVAAEVKDSAGTPVATFAQSARNDAAGLVTITLTAAQTNLFPGPPAGAELDTEAEGLVWGVTLTDSGGALRPIVSGLVRVSVAL